VVPVLRDVEQNHRSWLARGRETIELEGVTLCLGETSATLAFPRSDGDVATAVRTAVEHGVSEVGCWALAPDERLGPRLLALGFQDGWQPHWMGLEPTPRLELSPGAVEQSDACSSELPYGHGRALSDVAGHFVAREGEELVGHVALHVEGQSGGIYDMGVAPHARRRGHGTALTLAAVTDAHRLGCSTVTLNATGEGEPLYRSVGFTSLGYGMTWWLFPRRCR
jgi:ribosomal protein S18 acetylase RimI-like enzyme